VTERAIACVISICYDRHKEGEDGRALECHSKLLKLLVESGYPSYRLGIQSMREMDGHTSFHNLLRSFKKAIDPAGILAPGRYNNSPIPQSDSGEGLAERTPAVIPAPTSE
jgi:4-cresol dehydrogenase (hydroxylating)